MRRAATCVQCADVASQLRLGSCEGTNARKACRHCLNALAAVPLSLFYLVEIHLRHKNLFLVQNHNQHPLGHRDRGRSLSSDELAV